MPGAASTVRFLVRRRGVDRRADRGRGRWDGWAGRTSRRKRCSKCRDGDAVRRFRRGGGGEVQTLVMGFGEDAEAANWGRGARRSAVPRGLSFPFLCSFCAWRFYRAPSRSRSTGHEAEGARSGSCPGGKERGAGAEWQAPCVKDDTTVRGRTRTPYMYILHIHATDEDMDMYMYYDALRPSYCIRRSAVSPARLLSSCSWSGQAALIKRDVPEACRGRPGRRAPWDAASQTGTPRAPSLH